MIVLAGWLLCHFFPSLRLCVPPVVQLLLSCYAVIQLSCLSSLRLQLFGKLLTKTCLLIIIIKQFTLECVSLSCHSHPHPPPWGHCSLLQPAVAVVSAITAAVAAAITGISCSLLLQFLNVNYALCWLCWGWAEDEGGKQEEQGEQGEQE